MTSYNWILFLSYFDFSKYTYYLIDLRGYGLSSYNKAI
jgi:pimeloyl-ACP methyl ester carboxylesterase